MGHELNVRVLLLAITIFTPTGYSSNRKHNVAYVADPVGNVLSRPPEVPTRVGSPAQLARPDRYEFYTFDETGELVKRLMTLQEIQEIIATGETDDGHLLTIAHTNKKPQSQLNYQPPSHIKVHTIVNNVQNVLKAEMEAQKTNPPKQTILDTPDVSSSWSLILPAIFGNTGGSITPDAVMASHLEPETDVIGDLEKESDDTILPLKDITEFGDEFTTIPNGNQKIDPIDHTSDAENFTSNADLNVETKTTDHIDLPITSTSSIGTSTVSTTLKEYKRPTIVQTSTTKIVPPKISEPTTAVPIKISSTTSSRPTVRITTTQPKVTEMTKTKLPEIETTTRNNLKVTQQIITTNNVNKATHTNRPLPNIVTRVTTPETVTTDKIIFRNKTETTKFEAEMPKTSPKPVVSPLTTTILLTTKPVTEKYVAESKPIVQLKHNITTITLTNQPASEIPQLDIGEIINKIANDLQSTDSTQSYSTQKLTFVEIPAVTTAKIVETTNTSPISTKQDIIDTTTKRITTTTENVKNSSNKVSNLKQPSDQIPSENTARPISITTNVNEDFADDNYDDEYLEVTTDTTKYVEVTKPNLEELSGSITDLISQIVDDSRPTMIPLNKVTYPESITDKPKEEDHTTKKVENKTETIASTKMPVNYSNSLTDNVPIKNLPSSEVKSTESPIKVTQKDPIKTSFSEDIVPTTYRPSVIFIKNTKVPFSTTLINNSPSNKVTSSTSTVRTTVNTAKMEKIPNTIKDEITTTSPKTNIVTEAALKIVSSTKEIPEISEDSVTETTTRLEEYSTTTENGLTEDSELMEMLNQLQQIYQISPKLESKSDDFEQEINMNDKKGTMYKKTDDLDDLPQEKLDIGNLKDEENLDNNTKINVLNNRTETQLVPETNLDLKRNDTEFLTTITPLEILSSTQVSNDSDEQQIFHDANEAKHEPEIESIILANVSNSDFKHENENVSSIIVVLDQENISESNTNKLTQEKIEEEKYSIMNATKDEDNAKEKFSNNKTKTEKIKISDLSDDVHNVTSSPISSTKLPTSTVQFIPQTKATDSNKKTSVQNKNNEKSENYTEGVWKLVPTVSSNSNNNNDSKLQITTDTAQFPTKSDYNLTTKQVENVTTKLPQYQTPNDNMNSEIDNKKQGLEITTAALGEDVYQFTQLCNELAFRYLKAVSSSGPDLKRSLVISPFATVSLLAMMFLGARGATSGEMNDILKLDDMVTFNPHIVFKNVTESIEVSKKAGVATSAFVRELYSDRSKGRLLSFYKDRVQQFYSGHVEEINFNVVGDIIRRRTNLLVKRQTWGKIPEYIKGNNMIMRAPLSVFAANVFQTDCSSASTDGRDGEMYFVVSPSIRQRRLVPVPAVLYKGGFLAGYVPELDATVAALGGTNHIVSTIFVMPGQQGNTAQGDHILDLQERMIESAIQTGTWNKLLRSLVPRQGLELQIPRFSHRSIENGAVALQKMGLRDLFSAEKADLRGLNGIANDLHLSDIMSINTFTTCGEGFIGDQHHVEVYPGEPNKAQRRLWRTQRPVIQEVFDPPSISDTWEEHHDYQRAFHDPLYDNSYISMPLHLRPRQARLPDNANDQPRLKFDKPFMFFIRHNPTGLILYMGRYNPRLLP